MATSLATLKAAIESIDQTSLVNSMESQIDAILGDAQKALNASYGGPGHEYWIFHLDGYLTKAGKQALIAKYLDTSPGQTDPTKWKRVMVANSKEDGGQPGKVAVRLYATPKE